MRCRHFKFLTAIRPSLIPVIFIIIIPLFCSKGSKKSNPAGPPFKDLPAGILNVPDGRYFFNPPSIHYKKIQLGEVFIKKSDSSPSSRFYMSIAGIDSEDNYRIRSYEGRAHLTGDLLDLRAEKCYIFGKKEIDERLSPIERWDCDHLIFVFKIENNSLKWISQPRTKFADWAGPFNLKPAPADSVFAAQILKKTADGKIIAFGKDASRYLDSGHILTLHPGGAKFHTVKRYGDFIICSAPSNDPQVRSGAILYTSVPKKIKGLFDD